MKLMIRLLSTDFLKIRRKGIWFLIFLAPIGLAAMQGLNFGLRYDYLYQRYQDDLWGALLNNISMFVPMALFLGCTLISSMVANIEHQMSSWKQVLALPISRTSVYLSKLILCILLISVSCILLPICTLLLGLILGFGTQVPIRELALIGFVPYLAAWPLLSLQLWLSLTIRNQSLPVTIGISLGILAPFTSILSEWFPLNWPTLAAQNVYPLLFMGCGVALALMILLVSLIHFNRKDVD